MEKDMLREVVRRIVDLPLEFLGAIYDLLGKLLSEAGQEWLAELKKFLRKESCWTGSNQSKKTRFSIFVDYARSIEELVRLGKYDSSGVGFTTENFPTKRIGKVKMKVQFIPSALSITSKVALEASDKMGYRALEACELLTFGAKYPDIQREFPILALGSTFKDENNMRYVACLLKSEEGRVAYLMPDQVPEGWRIAVVRK
jgi:hypothetical protein